MFKTVVSSFVDEACALPSLHLFITLSRGKNLVKKYHLWLHSGPYISLVCFSVVITAVYFHSPGFRFSFSLCVWAGFSGGIIIVTFFLLSSSSRVLGAGLKGNDTNQHENEIARFI